MDMCRGKSLRAVVGTEDIFEPEAQIVFAQSSCRNRGYL